MQNKALAIATVTVVSILVTALFVYSQISELQNQISELKAQNIELQEQNSELQDQISKLQGQIRALQDQLNESHQSSPVRIVSVDYIGGFNPVVGLLIYSQVNVTIQNSGSTDISGLTLTVRLLNNNTEVGDGYAKQIDGLRAGEIREISGGIYYGIDSVFVIESTVKLGDVVLDEYIIG